MKKLIIIPILLLALLLIPITVDAASGVYVVSKTGDGNWTDDTWQVKIYPGETKSTTINLHNSASNSLDVEVSVYPDSLDDDNLIFELSKSNFIMSGGSYTNVTLTVKANGSTTPGNYTTELEIKSEVPPVQYDLTISSTSGGTVTTPGEGTFTYDAGTQVNLVASPDEGYQFIKWDNDVDTIADTQAAETAITMNGDYSIIALFGKTETVTDGTVDAKDVADTDVVVDGTATVSVAKYADNPGGPPPTGFSTLGKYIDVYVPNATNVTQIEIRLYYTAAEVESVSGESLRLLWLDGTEWRQCSPPAYSGVNATATNGYSGYLWVRIGTNTTPTLAQLTGMPFGAYGTPTVEYDLIIDSTEGGEVTKPGEGEFTYDAGTQVNLVASPASGYQFVNWTGDVATIANVNAATTTITMNGDYTITANFARKITPVPPGPGPAPTPTRYLTVDWDGTITKKPLYSNDRLAQDLLGLSPDGKHSLLLERGTHVPTVDGNPHYLIVIRELEETPRLPENTVAIVAVNITPEGAEFDRDIFLTLGLDQSQLPENALNVTMAYYDDVNEVWVPLESEAGGASGVAELTLSAPINHFSIFGVLAELVPAPPPPPAHFVASGLNIVTSVEKIWEPVTFVTRTGESVTITANVVNDGGQEGTYTVELKLNGKTVDTETVTLGAGQSQPVSFTVSGLDYGQYEVEVAGLSGEFTVSRSIDWLSIFGIIFAIGLITWVAIWGRRRWKKAA